MKTMQQIVPRAAFTFAVDESGQDLIEYALVAVVVAVVVAASVRSIQTAIINGVYNGISTVMSSF